MHLQWNNSMGAKVVSHTLTFALLSYVVCAQHLADYDDSLIEHS
jgi:hypothetical protein